LHYKNEKRSFYERETDFSNAAHGIVRILFCFCFPYTHTHTHTHTHTERSVLLKDLKFEIEK